MLLVTTALHHSPVVGLQNKGPYRRSVYSPLYMWNGVTAALAASVEDTSCLFYQIIGMLLQ